MKYLPTKIDAAAAAASRRSMPVSSSATSASTYETTTLSSASSLPSKQRTDYCEKRGLLDKKGNVHRHKFPLSSLSNKLKEARKEGRKEGKAGRGKETPSSGEVKQSLSVGTATPSHKCAACRSFLTLTSTRTSLRNERESILAFPRGIC